MVASSAPSSALKEHFPDIQRFSVSKEISTSVTSDKPSSGGRSIRLGSFGLEEKTKLDHSY